MNTDIIHSENERALELISFYLNFAADFIDKPTLENITGGDSSTEEYAFAALMAAACGLDTSKSPSDNRIFRRYFIPMVHRLNASDYTDNPYTLEVALKPQRVGKWELCRGSYRAFEAFVYNDPRLMPDGRIIPCIGYFGEHFDFPKISENGREWMTVTPNEINTMKEPVAAAHGRVLTFGLGLGYFAYMVARKAEVREVTVVERDAETIEIFKNAILPCFHCRDKIKIVNADAFDFCETHHKDDLYNLVFTDLWHDPSDGIGLYRKMKSYESHFPGSDFYYWIEKTLKLYIGDLSDTI